MLGVLHLDRDGGEFVLADRMDDFGRTVLGHEEVGPAAGEEREQRGVVDGVVRVETRTGALAAGGVGRIHEDRGLAAPAVEKRLEELQPITLREGDPVGVLGDPGQSRGEGVGIPAGEDAAAVLAVLVERCAAREDSGFAGAIEDEGAEAVIGDAVGVFALETDDGGLWSGRSV